MIQGDVYHQYGNSLHNLPVYTDACTAMRMGDGGGYDFLNVRLCQAEDALLMVLTTQTVDGRRDPKRGKTKQEQNTQIDYM